jgi:hypothetical protein
MENKPVKKSRPSMPPLPAPRPSLRPSRPPPPPPADPSRQMLRKSQPPPPPPASAASSRTSKPPPPPRPSARPSKAPPPPPPGAAARSVSFAPPSPVSFAPPSKVDFEEFVAPPLPESRPSYPPVMQRESFLARISWPPRISADQLKALGDGLESVLKDVAMGFDKELGGSRQVQAFVQKARDIISRTGMTPG